MMIKKLKHLFWNTATRKKYLRHKKLHSVLIMFLDSDERVDSTFTNRNAVDCAYALSGLGDLPVAEGCFQLLSGHRRRHQRQLRTWQADMSPQTRMQHMQQRRKRRQLQLDLAGKTSQSTTDRPQT